MSDAVAATTNRATMAKAGTALTVSLVAVVLWALAGVVDDALYVIVGVVGLVGAVLGWRALRAIPGGRPGRKQAMAATIIGGILATAVFVSVIVFLITGAE